MEGKNEGEDNPSRGNDWEVVTLTASTYAAAPGPKEVDQKDYESGKAYDEDEDEDETSRALFMSRHFVLPPSQHENLSLEPVNSEILDSQAGKNVPSELGLEEGGRSSCKNEEIWPLKGLDESEEFHGMQLFDVKGKNGKEFEESTTLQDFSDKEQSIYSTATFGSLHSETALGGSTTYLENLGIPEVNEPSEKGLDFPIDVPSSLKAAKDDNLPCDVWWKRRMASLYAHAKEANAFWSIFVAAAVMGIVILGQRWQQERWQVIINNERSGRILGPITRLKDVIVGGHRRGSFIRGSTSSGN
ncbi:ATG8-INTERACTING PROTEIN 2 [Salix purpurea]|uniref:ATG8-INTERACTING PROTEIN 2 n=1 Tax=Salix purpurea TaxID=77065 RepID=A0A9Q0PDX8_SALPP|nr:ATG8-INTERACTING PROTEIN 2 [Salix purpurea]KAJ6686260.1 ATG8-INTERACTING PROTEIN 2 [Salix purpurea]